MNQTLCNILFIGLGSMAGGIMRFLVTKFVKEVANTAFPWGTFIVNVAGCLILGLIYGLFERGWQLPDGMRLLLTVGFCGGFTTFSTFMNDNYLLISGSQIISFFSYIMLSVLGGYLALIGGYYLTRIY